jgi:hypothetical protein
VENSGQLIGAEIQKRSIRAEISGRSRANGGKRWATMKAERRAKVDPGGHIRSVETEWRRELRIDEAERGEKMDPSGQGAIVEESGQAQAVYRSGSGFVIED